MADIGRPLQGVRTLLPLCLALTAGACSTDSAERDAPTDTADSADTAGDDATVDTGPDDAADVDVNDDAAAPDVDDRQPPVFPPLDDACPAATPLTDVLHFPPEGNLVWERNVEFATVSSPTLIDINGDCVLDVLLGRGEELVGENPDGRRFGRIAAFDGTDGSTIWEQTTPEEIFSRPLLVDLTADGVPEVVVAGRGASFAALTLRSGELIWEFDRSQPPLQDRWSNFYRPAIGPDVTGDGIPDLITVNGALTDAEAFEPREVNHLVIVSGADGVLLHAMEMPDGAESYLAPEIVDRPDGPFLVFGSGGETQAGSLWMIPLADAMAGSLQTAVTLVEPRSTRGFMTAPSLVDLTEDGWPDLVVAAFDGRIIALDNRTLEELWSWSIDDHETYAAAAVGLYDNDTTPDIAALFVLGNWNDGYQGSTMVILSGADGSELLRQTSNGVWPSSPLMLDLDGVGSQDALFLNSRPSGLELTLFSYGSDAPIWTFNLGDELAFGTPTVGDLNRDGVFELVIPATTFEWETGPEQHLKVLSLDATLDEATTWSGYLGRFGDGRWPAVGPRQ